MKFVMFYHSLLSDWNHGNAHFLRGIATDLIARGYDVKIYEPENNWSLSNMINDGGKEKFPIFYQYYPTLKTNFFDPEKSDPARLTKDADVVVIHEWNDKVWVKKMGEYHGKKKKFILLFHDTHHRAVSAKKEISAFDLTHYDGVLAFGNIIRDLYLEQNWTHNAFTWHEAADTRIFYPHESSEKEGDVVWIGNWGDNERSAEIEEFFIKPVSDLKLKAAVYGVRYPENALEKLKKYNIEYKGWAPNFLVPKIFSRYNLTVHIPRKPYVQSLPGIPTIRPFEAMACGIPLISAPWNDAENLFTEGKDYLMVNSGDEMKAAITTLLKDEGKRKKLTANGLKKIRSRHTCTHRVDELLEVIKKLKKKEKQGS